MSQCCLIKQVIICFDAPSRGAISIILMNVCARGAKPLRGLYGWGLYPMYVATRRAWGYARLARLRRALPMQHADTPQVVGTCHGMSPNACTSGAVICACVSLCVTCHGMSADATPLISTALGDMSWHVPTTYERHSSIYACLIKQHCGMSLLHKNAI